MRYVVVVARTALAAAVVASSACKGAKETATFGGAGSTTQGMTQAGEIGMRQEAQTHFDSARSFFLAGNRALAGRNLRDAAAFIRSHADSAAGGVTTALSTSAAELETVATSIENNAVTSVAELDAASARAQCAEAQYHFARAKEGWTAKHWPRTVDELTMAIDHFERAAKDGGQRLDATADSALAAVRQFAARVRSGEIVSDAEYGRVATDFDHALRDLGARLTPAKR